MSLSERLQDTSTVSVHQRTELAELVGFESRNKYEILDGKGNKLGFCAEQQKGVRGFFLRQLFGHWRKFDLYFFDPQGNVGLSAHHPFRWFLQSLFLATPEGISLGDLRQRFGLFTRKFDLRGPEGETRFRMRSSLLSFWSFPIYDRSGVVVAMIRKKWSGLLQELFTDKDNFRIEFLSRSLTPEDRLLILAGAIFVDLRYFERKD